MNYAQLQSIINQYQTSETSFSLDTMTGASSSSESSDSTSSVSSSSSSSASLDSISATLAEIQMSMMAMGMEKNQSMEHENMEAFKDNADAILNADDSISTDDKEELLASLQSVLTDFSPLIEGLDASTDLTSLSDEEVDSLFDSVQDAIETLKNNPPERRQDFMKALEAYDSSSSDVSMSGDLWMEQLNALLSGEDTYSQTDLSDLLDSIVESI